MRALRVQFGWNGFFLGRATFLMRAQAWPAVSYLNVLAREGQIL